MAALWVVFVLTHSLSVLSSVKTWNRGTCGTPLAQTQHRGTKKQTKKTQKETMTQCCHINTITNDSMQNEKLVEWL